MNFELLFALGMKRNLTPLVAPFAHGNVVLELGPGNSPLPFATHTLEWPAWNGETDPLPFGDETVGAVWAMHMIEHLPGAAVIRLLREVERVLVPGGTFTIVVPHRLGALAHEDLDHKTIFTEDTWKTLFSTAGYTKHREAPWRLSVGFNLIAGINERNLALFTQLVKDPS